MMSDAAEITLTWLKNEKKWMMSDVNDSDMAVE